MADTVADLHVHTTRSDGGVDPDALAAVAADASLSAVAITDHDRLPPWSEPARRFDDVTVISGIELRVEAPAVGRVDLLGYALEPTDALRTRLETLQTDRIDRARRMVDALEETLDITLDIAYERGIGRPHLARAVAAATELTPQAVFDRYIGDDGPCYVPRSIPRFETGRSLLADAAEAVVLAHPLRYDEPHRALELVAHLDGVELAYPYGRGVDREPLEHFDTTDVLVTGGSDAHEVAAIGRCGLDRDAYRAVADRLDVAMD